MNIPHFTFFTRFETEAYWVHFILVIFNPLPTNKQKLGNLYVSGKRHKPETPDLKKKKKIQGALESGTSNQGSPTKLYFGKQCSRYMDYCLFCQAKTTLKEEIPDNQKFSQILTQARKTS